MPRMVRKQIYIERTQDKKLRLAARLSGVSQAEFIRKGVGRELLGMSETSVGSDFAWKKALKVMKDRAKQKDVVLKERNWKRDDLYAR